MANKRSSQSNFAQIFSQPLIILVISVLTILVIISLRESANKAKLVKENLAKNQANVAQLREEVELKKNFLDNSQSDLYKEKLQRNELLKQQPEEIILQVALPEEAKSENLTNQELSRQEKRQQNWQSWWQLILKNK